MSTVFPAKEAPTKISCYVDGDWGGDEVDRKSVMGGAIMVAGCRMRARSRGAQSHALSSAESEIMSASELLREAKALQHLLKSVGFGELPIEMLTDAAAAKAFMHRRGAGRMKHMDIRCMWLQEECERGGYIPKKLPREFNASDMLTKVLAQEKIDKLLKLIRLQRLQPLKHSRRRSGQQTAFVGAQTKLHPSVFDKETT